MARGSFQKTLLLFFTVIAATSAQEKERTACQDSAAFEHFRTGSVYFRNNDFREAVESYRKAFDLEKQNPTLSRQIWYVLIDNLGMSYGISGDLSEAQEIFEYGISKDSTYPLFYYNMACTYAEREDLDVCIKYLRMAFTYRANMLEGEEFPDPSTDDSFQRFMKNDEFLRLLKEFGFTK